MLDTQNRICPIAGIDNLISNSAGDQFCSVALETVPSPCFSFMECLRHSQVVSLPFLPEITTSQPKFCYDRERRARFEKHDGRCCKLGPPTFRITN